ncbi:MAG: hypothetical protein K2X46_02855, partial [Roseomonas sp.]|nr:hypothetical protein [Roseomonas sp.]
PVQGPVGPWPGVQGGGAPLRATIGAGGAALPLLLLAACAPPSPARPPEAGLAATATVAEIRSGQAPNCNASGAAIHLGGGRFVTAAHVVDGSVQRLRGFCPPDRQGQPAITLGVRGTEAPARILRAGRDRVDAGIGQRYLGGEDLAIIAPTRPLPGLPAATPCATPPPPGTPALLVTPRRSIRTRLLAPWSDPDRAFGSYLEIPETLAPGESGGAVFVATSGCLAGIVSHRDSDGGPPSTRLVPASTIARFMQP